METTAYQYTSEFPTIYDVTSEENHNIALLYSSTSGNQWRAMAFQTNITIRRTEWISEVTTLDAGDSLAFGMLQEDGHSATASADPESRDDRLRVDDQRGETLVEYGIGVEPDGVLVGVENPSGSYITGVQGDRARGFDEETLQDFGSVKSDATITANGIPTTAASSTPEQGVVRMDSDDNGLNPTRVAFHNDTDGTVTVDVTVMGLTYHVTPVTDSATVRDIVYGRGHNRRVLTYGGFDNTSPNVPQDWRDGRVTMTSDDALEVIQNR